MRSATANRAISLAVLLVAVAAAAGLAVWKHTVTVAAAAAQPQPHSAAVNTVLRACPAPGLAGAATSQVALIAGPGTTGTGRAVVSRIGASTGAPLASVTQPGALTVTGVRAAPAATRHLSASGKAAQGKPAHGKTPSPSPTPSASPASQPVATVPAAGGVVIQASGAMAQGLEAEQVMPGGKISARCDGPGTDFWFVGPGAFTVGHIQLYLMNVGSQPADVDVQAYTDAGPLQGSTDTGVAVAPHTMVTQSLDKMLHGTRMIALNVRTSVGQVVAAVEETKGAHAGAWLPLSAAPGTGVVIPGMPPTAGTRQLFVAVPGTQAAHITLSAVTRKGSYHPTGGGGLDIPGGSVAELSLTSLSAIYGALQISSNVPVTAALMTPGGPRGTPGTFTGATRALQEQGVVAANVSSGGAVSSLVLSAPWRAVRVRVTEVGASGQGPTAPGKVVLIQAHRSLLEQLTAPAGTRRGSAFAVVVTPLPGSGPLYAGRVVISGGRGGALQSVLPVSSALTVVPLPDVQNELVTPGR